MVAYLKTIYAFIYHRINKLTQYGKVAATMPNNRHNLKYKIGGEMNKMNTTHRIRLIVAVAVTLTIAIAGIVSASPPVPPPNETSIIESSVVVNCLGTVTEMTDFETTYTTKDLSDGNLSSEERVAQILYDDTVKAVGSTEFSKDLKFDGANAPNLEIPDRRLGFQATVDLTSWADSTENVGLSIVTAGDMEGIGGPGLEGICPWASGGYIPAGNEMIAAGSKLEKIMLVTSKSVTKVTSTDSPALSHLIDADGMTDETGTYAAVGKISAGMTVRTMEGGANTNYPPTVPDLAGVVVYEDMTTADGSWDFYKKMSYKAQIKDFQLPRTYPVFA
jgi:hypothetical protein